MPRYEISHKKCELVFQALVIAAFDNDGLERNTTLAKVQSRPSHGGTDMIRDFIMNLQVGGNCTILC